MNDSVYWQFSLQATQAVLWLLFLLAFLWWGQRASLSKLLAWCVFLTLDLVMIGAYVRLEDAGLGCPDWPGCFASFTPVQARAQIELAVAEQGGVHGPVSHAKAWKEMVHRYWASGIGILILLLVWRSQRQRDVPRSARWWAWVCLLVVLLQGLFGKWTVTLRLMPWIVTVHLLGGLTLLALLVLMQARLQQQAAWLTTKTRRLTVVAGLLLLTQIALGGWTSSNYAGLACAGFPTCNGSWMPELDLANAFTFFRPLGYLPDGSLLSFPALQSIAWLHRWLAWLVVAAFFWLAWQLHPRQPRLAWLWVLLPSVQVALGIANVLTSLPLVLAVAHNGVAAIWLVSVVHVLARGVDRQALTPPDGRPG